VIEIDSPLSQLNYNDK